MTVTKANISTDFNETSLDCGRAEINAQRLADCHVYCSRFDATTARRLQGQHGFALTIIPTCLLPSAYAWAVEYEGDIFWSPGCI